MFPGGLSRASILSVLAPSLNGIKYHRSQNNSSSKHKQPARGGPIPPPTGCHSGERGGTLESVQPGGRCGRWAGQFCANAWASFLPLRRSAGVFPVSPFWSLLTFRSPAICAGLWSSWEGRRATSEQLEMVSPLTGLPTPRWDWSLPAEIGYGLIRHLGVTAGVCG